MKHAMKKAKRGWGWLCGLPIAWAAVGCGGDLGEGADGELELEADDVDVAEQDLALLSNTLWPPLWTGLTRIPVCFKNGTTAQRTNVQTVAEGGWEALGATITGPNGRYGVDFTGWGNCPTSTAGQIPITFNTTGTNKVTGLGRTITKMDLSTTAPNQTILHEFGHALGYTHEFRRSDYAAVDPSCTETQGTVPDLGVTAVDTQSIMNYVSCGRAGFITLSDAAGHMALYGPWNVAYGRRLAIRHDPSWNYVRGDSTPDTSSAAITSSHEFRLVNVSNPSSTGQVNFGDSVQLKTNDGQYLKSNGRNNLVTKTSTTSSATTWQVFGRISSGPIRVNDEVLFRASDTAYLKIDSSERLTTDVGALFRLIDLSSALNI